MNWTDYIKPELLALVPVLYFIGWAVKRAQHLKDALIPFLLMGIGVVLAAIWVLATSQITNWQEALMAVFTAIVQGLLCAGAAVLANQSIKQGRELAGKESEKE